MLTVLTVLTEYKMIKMPQNSAKLSFLVENGQSVVNQRVKRANVKMDVELEIR